VFLNCPDEVFRFIGRTLQTALTDPALAPRLTALPQRVRLGFVDPDCVLVVDTERREVRPATPTDEPSTGLVAMNGDTALRYCQGRLDIMTALANGDIAMYGEVAQLLDLLGDPAGLPRLFPQVLRAEGREDLLVA